MKRIFLVWIVVAGIGLCGCVMDTETVYNNPERVKVEFENETAGRIFYETLSKAKTPMNRDERDTTIKIPVVFESHRHVVQGQNVAFNEAVRQCDSNQDGRITELEARIYSEHNEK